MKGNLDRRLNRLEKTTGGTRSRRAFTLEGHDTRMANAIREAGIEPKEGDMVVFLRQFDDDWRDRPCRLVSSKVVRGPEPVE